MYRSNTDMWLSLDLEMNMPSGRIIEIGACVGNLRTGEVLDKFQIFVTPEEPLNPEITALTGITEEDLRMALHLPAAVACLQEFILANRPFINPIVWGGGDSAAITKQMQETFPDYQSPFGRRWLDAKTLYVAKRLRDGKPPVGGLAKAMRYCGLKFEGKKHRALDDAANTFKMAHFLVFGDLI